MSELTQGSIYDFENVFDMRGDFIGFTFDGIHSSKLNIVRISEGDRYEESLVPSSNIKTTAIPGGDGTYYFGTNYTQRNITIQIAFDHLTQTQIARIVSLFGTKRIVPLIFDENPYKVYYVKVSSDPRLTYLCFDEDGQRIYKGEGSIPLICYSPFARSRFKYLEDYTVDNIPEWAAPEGTTYDYSNLDEWIDASGIRTKTYNGIEYDTYIINTGYINLWNGGQLPTDFNLYIPFEEGSNTIPAFYINLQNAESQLYLNEITKENPSDVKIKINTRTNLIEGIGKDGKITGSIYNKYIEKGNFFKIPTGWYDEIEKRPWILHTSQGIAHEEIEYDFLYY